MHSLISPRPALHYILYTQGVCGYAPAAGPPCAASVCLEKMAAHYVDAHNAEMRRSVAPVNVLADGSKSLQISLNYSFEKKEKGSFIPKGICPYIFKPAIGGCFALDLRRFSASELRFGVRQLGRGPPHYRLASAKVRFGAEAGSHVQYLLPRALTAEERLADDALSAGTPPAVVRVDPAFLLPALVLSSTVPPPEKPWNLDTSVTLMFEVVKDADPTA